MADDSAVETADSDSQPGLHATAAGADSGVWHAEYDPERLKLAARMAERMCLGFKLHDDREYEAAVDAWTFVDKHQFSHLDPAEARDAAAGYIEALQAKDEVEDPYMDGQEVADRRGLMDAEWSRIEDPLLRRAVAIGADGAYARLTVEGWKRHKLGGDYWTPLLGAQHHEVVAAVGDAYPEKENGFGESGYGFFPALYLAGVELHDLHTEHHWYVAMDVMTGYFAEILRLQAEVM